MAKNEDNVARPLQEDTTDNANNEAEPTKDIVELEWEEVQNLFFLRGELASMEQYYTKVSLQLEKNKASVVSRILQLESVFYEQANTIKNEKVGDTDSDYEIKLPNDQNEKGFLIKK
jgi:hypothetical protein